MKGDLVVLIAGAALLGLYMMNNQPPETKKSIKKVGFATNVSPGGSPFMVQQRHVTQGGGAEPEYSVIVLQRQLAGTIASLDSAVRQLESDLTLAQSIDSITPEQSQEWAQKYVKIYDKEISYLSQDYERRFKWTDVQNELRGYEEQLNANSMARLWTFSTDLDLGMKPVGRDTRKDWVRKIDALREAIHEVAEKGENILIECKKFQNEHTKPIKRNMVNEKLEAHYDEDPEPIAMIPIESPEFISHVPGVSKPVREDALQKFPRQQLIDPVRARDDITGYAADSFDNMPSLEDRTPRSRAKEGSSKRDVRSFDSFKRSGNPTNLLQDFEASEMRDKVETRVESDTQSREFTSLQTPDRAQSKPWEEPPKPKKLKEIKPVVSTRTGAVTAKDGCKFSHLRKFSTKMDALIQEAEGAHSNRAKQGIQRKVKDVVPERGYKEGSWYDAALGQQGLYTSMETLIPNKELIYDQFWIKYLELMSKTFPDFKHAAHDL